MFSQGWLLVLWVFLSSMTASSMVSLFSLLYGLLLENTHVVSAIIAATLTAQLLGRICKLLHVHDISSKTRDSLPKSRPQPMGKDGCADGQRCISSTVPPSL